MATEMLVSSDMIEDLSALPDDLWECLLDNESLSTTSQSVPESVSSTSELEEKLLSLEERVSRENSLSTDEILGEFRDANHADLDAILAKDIERLSLGDRDKCVEDLYGVGSPPVHEDRAFVDEKLSQMEDCLSKIPQKDAYDRAKYMSPDYVQDRKRRLMFLRSEEFDPQKAANVYVYHFNEKLALFGSDLLVRDITLDDIDDCEEELKSGVHQILPTRDRADRTIICCPPIPKRDPRRVINFSRVFFYVFMTALQDEDTQRNGIVVIALNVGPNREYFEEVPFLMRDQKVARAFPCRLAGFHYVYDAKFLYPLVTFTRFLFGSYLRGKYMTHCGTYSEYTYRLQTYGIPTQDLPIDSDGNLLVENHLEWLERRRKQEASGVRAAAVVPRRFDVLMGRGRAISAHTGNLRAVHIVEMNRERYEKATKFEKTQIAERCVHLVHQSYGRFLKKEEGEWVEASQEEAREKFAHCFRRLRGLKAQGGNTKPQKRLSRGPSASTDAQDSTSDMKKKSKS